MKQVIRLLKMASIYKWWMLLAALFGFLTVGSGIGLLMTSAYIISKAALHPSVAELQVGIVGVRFFGISRGIFRYLERLVSHDTTFKMLTKFRVWFYKALEPLAPARLQKYQSADLLNRIVSDVQTLEHFYVRVIAPPLVAVGVSFLMWFLLGAYSLTFSVTLLFFHLMAGLAVPVISYLYSKNIGGRIISKRAEMNILILDQIQGLNELLIFGQDQAQRQKIATVNVELEHLNQKMARVSAMHESLIGLFMNGAVAVMLVLAIPMVNQGMLDGVYLAVISLGIMASFEALLPLPETLQFLEKNSNAAQRLFELIDTKPEVSDQPEVQKMLEPGDLTFENLSFRYDPELPAVLEELSMHFPQSSKTAIVGPSGAGKSTILNVLLRFWDYQEGAVLINGQDIKNLSQDAARRHFGVVRQSTYLFNLTIRENLILANDTATQTDIDKALDQAYLKDYVLQLDKKYEAEIGDQGQQMSGGERQRMAIARAILKDAPVILLDEATSNLDVLTEQSVLNTILETSAEKTLIHITHRLTGLDKFDQIYVLKKGRVVQSGNYRDLIITEGLFREMWRLQRQQDALEG